MHMKSEVQLTVLERRVQEPKKMVILLIMKFARAYKMMTGMLYIQIQELMDLMLILKKDFGSVMMTKILQEKRRIMSQKKD